MLLSLSVLLIFVTKNQRIIVGKEKSYLDYDYLACKEIPFKPERDKCYIQSLFYTASKTKNVQFCGLISQYVPEKEGKIYELKCKENLYFMKASEQLDLYYCNIISDSFLRTACVEQVFSNLKVFNDKRELCLNIRNSAKRYICLENAFISLKEYSISSEFCDRYSDVEKEICVRVLT